MLDQGDLKPSPLQRGDKGEGRAGVNQGTCQDRSSAQDTGGGVQEEEEQSR